jgi:hypothetical protein
VIFLLIPLRQNLQQQGQQVRAGCAHAEAVAPGAEQSFRTLGARQEFESSSDTTAQTFVDGAARQEFAAGNAKQTFVRC